MHPLLKKILAVCLSAFALFLAYYGSYLPLAKSENFISTVKNLGGVHSLSDFESSFSVPLDIPSPIGQEELVRNMASDIVLRYLSSSEVRPEAIAELLRFTESYYAPLIAYGKGMSFTQNLYILGTLNMLAFVHTKQPQYLSAAETYFLEGLAMSPKRPQFLYSLLDVYRAEGDAARTKLVADEIAALWNDPRIAAMAATSTASSARAR